MLDRSDPTCVLTLTFHFKGDYKLINQSEELIQNQDLLVEKWDGSEPEIKQK